VFLRRNAGWRAILVDETHVPGHKRPFLVGGKGFHSGSDGIRKQPVVGIEEDQVFPSALTEPSTTRSRGPLVSLFDKARRRVLPDDRDCVVRRPVVDDDDLDRGKRLPQCAVDRVGQKSCLVVAGNHDRHERVLRRGHRRRNERGNARRTVFPVTPLTCAP
jgi:hypothetical protein